MAPAAGAPAQHELVGAVRRAHVTGDLEVALAAPCGRLQRCARRAHHEHGDAVERARERDLTTVADADHRRGVVSQRDVVARAAALYRQLVLGVLATHRRQGDARREARGWAAALDRHREGVPRPVAACLRHEPRLRAAGGAELARQHEVVAVDPVLVDRRPAGADPQRELPVRRRLDRDLGAAAHDLLGGPQGSRAVDAEARAVPAEPSHPYRDVEVPAPVAPPPEGAQAAWGQRRRESRPGDVEGPTAGPHGGIAALDVARADADAPDPHAQALEPTGGQRHERDALGAPRRRADALDERPAVDAQAAVLPPQAIEPGREVEILVDPEEALRDA